jgi:hypothetical protein
MIVNTLEHYRHHLTFLFDLIINDSLLQEVSQLNPYRIKASPLRAKTLYLQLAKGGSSLPSFKSTASCLFAAPLFTNPSLCITCPTFSMIFPIVESTSD